MKKILFLSLIAASSIVPIQMKAADHAKLTRQAAGLERNIKSLKQEISELEMIGEDDLAKSSRENLASEEAALKSIRAKLNS